MLSLLASTAATPTDVGVGVLIAVAILDKALPFIRSFSGEAKASPGISDRFTQHCSYVEGLLKEDSPRRHTEQLVEIANKLDRMCGKLDRLIEIGESCDSR